MNRLLCGNIALLELIRVDVNLRFLERIDTLRIVLLVSSSLFYSAHCEFVVQTNDLCTVYEYPARLKYNHWLTRFRAPINSQSLASNTVLISFIRYFVYFTQLSYDSYVLKTLALKTVPWFASFIISIHSILTLRHSCLIETVIACMYFSSITPSVTRGY